MPLMDDEDHRRHHGPLRYSSSSYEDALAPGPRQSHSLDAPPRPPLPPRTPILARPPLPPRPFPVDADAAHTSAAYNGALDELSPSRPLPPIASVSPPSSSNARGYSYHPAHSSPRSSGSKFAPSLTLDTQFDGASDERHTNGHDPADSSVDDISPDPHEFYRPFQAPVHSQYPPPPRRAPSGANPHAGPTSRYPSEVAIPPRTSSSSRAQRRSDDSWTAARRASGAGPVLKPAGATPDALRASTTTTDQTPAARTVSGSSRSQSSALRDLVKRFNQTPDEPPPLPARPGVAADIMAASATNPAAKRARTSTTRTTASRTTARADASSRSGRLDPAQEDAEHAPLARPRDHADVTQPARTTTPSSIAAAPPRPSSTSATKPDRPRVDAANNPWASRSMTTLHLSHSESARRPLFGEVLSVVCASDAAEAGFGIAGVRPADPDELARPSLAHRRVKSHAGASPTSPTAWYLGAVPSPAGTRVGRSGSPLPRPSHRRAQSDFAGVSSLAASIDPPGPHALLPADPGPKEPQSETYPHSAAMPPRSRIPLSSRRQSTPSEHGGPASPTHSNSGASSDFHRRDHPSAGQSGIPKPNSKPPAAMPARPVTPARSSSRRYDVNDRSRTGSSPRLKAYISAAPPKKSPPLRSSRPRLSVSSASTSPAQAKSPGRTRTPNEEGSNAQRGSTGAKTKPKATGPVGALDFAARREHIHRALTKSVRDGQSKRPHKVQASRKDGAPPAAAELPARTGERPTRPPHSIENASGEGANGAEAGHGERGQAGDDHANARFPAKADETAPDETTPLEATPIADARPDQGAHDREQLAHVRFERDGEDSPTLGMPGGFPATPEVVLQPVVSEGASTAVDPVNAGAEEASISESPQPRAETPVSTRKSTPAEMIQVSPGRGRPDPDMLTLPMTTYRRDAISDIADKESIRIMLEASPILPENHERSTRSSCFEEVTPIEDDVRDSEYEFLSRSLIPGAPEQEASSAPNGSSTVNHESKPTPDHSREGDTTSAWANDRSEPPPRLTPPDVDSPAYNAINRFLEHYHEDFLTSPEGVRYLQQQLLTQTPDLARLGGWDSKRVTRLFLQNMGLTPSSLIELESLPARHEYGGDPSEERHERASRDEPAGTDIDSDGPEPAVDEEDDDDRPRYELSEGGWSSARPSLDAERDQEPPMGRASLQFRDDWEDTSPSIADWIRPPTDSPLDGEGSTGLRHTPLSHELRSSPSPRESAELPAQTPRRFLDREGAATPRLLADERARSLETDTAGEGLGLSINIEGHESSAIFHPPPPPPIPDHAPPPPPIPELDEGTVSDQARPFDGPRSPPSPSVYSRHPTSRMFPTQSPDHLLNGDHLVRASNVSAQLQNVVAPAVPRVDSGSSSPPRQVNGFDPLQQQASHSTATSANSSDEQRRLNKRRMLIKELLETEKSYYKDVNLTQEVYKATSEACPSLTAEDVKILFGNGDQIVSFSMAFYDALRVAARSVHAARRIEPIRSSISTANSGATTTSSEDQASLEGTDFTDDEKDRLTTIGEVFIEHLARMEKLYSEYLKNHDAANKRLAKLQEQPYVKHWLEACYRMAYDLTSAWSLDSLLVKPVQRISKYPLLLEPLLQLTPEDHPDYVALEAAVHGMRAVMQRINDMKRRVDFVEHFVKRKRKESDVRGGLSKALGRGTDKIREKVGHSGNSDDPAISRLIKIFDEKLTQIPFYMKDVADYLDQVQEYVDHFVNWVHGMEQFIESGKGIHLELESKWRKFGIVIRELSMVALPEHKVAVSTSMLEPMRAVLILYERPKLLIQKRNKRLPEYNRYRTLKERGEKIDKRTREHGEHVETLTEALQEELPRLFTMTAKLADGCLRNFVKLQVLWHATWELKVQSTLEDRHLGEDLDEIVKRFHEDFRYVDKDVLSLALCNGSAVAGIANLLSPQSTRQMEDLVSAKRPSMASSRSRTISLNSTSSPGLAGSAELGRSYTAGSQGTSFSPAPIVGSPPPSRQRQISHHGHQSVGPGARPRAASTASNPGNRASDTVPAGNAFYQSAPNGTAAVGSSSSSSMVSRPTTGNRTSSTTGREKIDMAASNPARHFSDTAPLLRTATAGSTTATAQSRAASSSTVALELPGISPSNDRPFSGLFSSAMPMADSRRGSATSPHTSRPPTPPPSFLPKDGNTGQHNVLFLAVTRSSHTVDPDHRYEARYPFLSFAEGDIFDVVADHGHMYLARNQDDETRRVGWIAKDQVDVIPIRP